MLLVSLWNFALAVGFKNRMAYVHKKGVHFLFGDLSWLSQELHPAQQGTQRFSVFPEHLSALPQSSARTREMTETVRSCCRSLQCMCGWPCLLLESEEKQLGPHWGRFHSQEETESSSMSGEEQC